MRIFLVATFLFVMASSGNAWAQQRGYIYEKPFNTMGKSYVDLLSNKETDNLNSIPSEKRNTCLQRYSSMLDDGVLDIRIALGYFDWTIGRPVTYEGTNVGLSPSLDIGGYSSLSSLLKKPCYGQTSFCGFQQDQNNIYLFYKDVSIHGRSIKVKLEMHFSSATELLNQNLGASSNDQKLRSQYAENFFLKSLREADAAFYFGHSRNGGGPDFLPPIFISGTNRVDYKGYYEKYRPGLNKMVAALSQSSRQASVIGMMSCASRPHFLSTIRKVAPHSGIITSTSVLEISEVYTALIGAVDGLLRGQCQQSFYQSIRMTAKNQKYITMDGMFE